MFSNSKKLRLLLEKTQQDNQKLRNQVESLHTQQKLEKKLLSEEKISLRLKQEQLKEKEQGFAEKLRATLQRLQQKEAQLADREQALFKKETAWHKRVQAEKDNIIKSKQAHQTQVRTIKQALADLSQTETQIKAHLLELHATQNEKQKELKHIQKYLVEATELLQWQQEQIAQLNQELSLIEHHIEQQQSQKTALTDSIAAQSIALEKLNKKIEAAAQTQARQEQTVFNLSQEIEQKTQSAQKLEQQIQALTEDEALKTAALTTVLTKITEAAQTQAQQEQTVLNLSQEIEQKTQAAQKLEQQIQALAEDEALKTAALTTVLTKITETAQTQAQQEQSLFKLPQTIEQQEKYLENIQAQITQATEKQIYQLKEESARKTSELASLQTQITLQQQIIVDSEQLSLNYAETADSVKFSDSVFGDWLKNFFAQRQELSNCADGRALYAYTLNQTEYIALKNLFVRLHSMPSANNPSFSECGACYCLIISEIYRREYEGGNWSWEFFDQKLNLPFKNPQKRYELIRNGLRYWGRNYRISESGLTQYLGTLFAEGGLPIPLLTKEDNKFAEIFNYGLAYYQQSLKENRPLEDYLTAKQDILAQALREESIMTLFADTVRTLMQLAETFELEQQDNPAAYLDQQQINWRDRFPFALPEKQADDLINQCLSNATNEYKANILKHIHYSHHVRKDEFTLFVRLKMPQEFLIPLKNYQGKTFLQWQIYEGEHQLPKIGGKIFVNLSEDSNELILNFNQLHYEFDRDKTELPLSIRFYADGILLHSEILADSAISFDSPCLFIEQHRNQDWQLISNSEFTHCNQPYLIALPQGFSVNEAIECLYQDPQTGQSWFHHNAGLKAYDFEGQCIEVQYKTSLSQPVYLYGQECDFLDKDSRPIYRAWPQLRSPAHLPCTHIRISNQELRPPYEVYGRFMVGFYSDKTLLLRRHISVLPKDIAYTWKAATSHKTGAELSLNGIAQLQVQTSAPQDFEISGEHNQWYFKKPRGMPPAAIELKLNTEGYAPVVLSFPYQTAQLLHDDIYMEQKTVRLDQLMGKRIDIALSNTHKMLLTYCLSIDTKIQRSIDYHLSKQNKQVGLFALRDSFLHILSCSNQQDAAIKLALISSGQELISLSIQRYDDALIVKNNSGESAEHPHRFSIRYSNNSLVPCSDLMVCVIRLDKPKLPEQRLDADADNHYQLPAEQGIYFVYPAADSAIRFCPKVLNYADKTKNHLVWTESLEKAICAYHPQDNPKPIAAVIERMKNDPAHSAWQYFEQLQKNDCAHLPLSAFEPWRALAQSQQALALAVLRLNLDQEFCQRMREELAVVWEWLPLPVWQKALHSYSTYLHSILSKIGIEANNLPAIDETQIPLNILCNSEILRRYLRVRQTQERVADRVVIYEQFEEMRNPAPDSHYNYLYNRIRSHNLAFCTELNQTIEQWLNTANLSLPEDMLQLIKRLRQREFTEDRSLVFLPFFIACVKVGLAHIEDIRPADISDAAFVDLFYQVYHLSPEWFERNCSTFTSYLIEQSL